MQSLESGLERKLLHACILRNKSKFSDEKRIAH